MQAADVLGLKDSRKIIHHLILTFSVTYCCSNFGCGWIILSESALSYLGLGVVPPTPSWGT